MTPQLEYLLYIAVGIILSILIGAVAVWAVYYIYDYFYFKKLKKEVPSKDKLVNPNIEIIEEVNEDESLNKNRELEKFTKLVDNNRLSTEDIK
jgi:hypothetical protein